MIRAHEQRSILVADDDQVVSTSFSEIVTNHGFRVKTAFTMRRGLVR